VADEGTDKPMGMQINLSPEAREIVDQIKKDTGVAKITAVTRILQWFGEQDREIRVRILDGGRDVGEFLARQKLSQMAGGERVEQLTFEQASQLIRLATDRLDQLGRYYQRQVGDLHKEIQRIGKHKR
jgi:hypothetical protein